MQQRHYLIADDVDDAKIMRIRTAIECSDPFATIHVARSVREAMALIGAIKFDAGAIDYDFLGEPENGGDIIGALRQRNQEAAIALVTAREDESYHRAGADAFGMGADAAYSSANAFEGELQSTFRLAA